MKTSPEAQFPLEYAVPFNWGAITVSKKADEEFGLPQFSSSIIREPEPKDVPRELIEIQLLGTDEWSERFPEIPKVGNIYIVSKNIGGIATTSFALPEPLCKTIDKIDRSLEEEKARIEEENEHELEFLDTDTKAELESQVVHFMAQASGERTRSLLVKKDQEDRISTAADQLTNAIVTPTLLSSVAYGLSYAIPRFEVIHSTNGAFSLAMLTLLASGINLGKVFKKSSLSSMPTGKIDSLALAVYKDFHATFCRDSFNHDMDKIFGSNN